MFLRTAAYSPIQLLPFEWNLPPKEAATQTTPVLKIKEECEDEAHKSLQAGRSQIQSNSSVQGSATMERRVEVKRFHVFFCFFEDVLVLMWTIFKVFVEYVNMLPLLLTFLFFGREACGVLVPRLRVTPSPHLEGKVLTTGLPGSPKTPLLLSLKPAAL